MALAVQRAYRLLVEELDDRTTPSAVALGLDSLSLQWLSHQQLMGSQSDICQSRQIDVARPTITYGTGTISNSPPRHEVIIVDAAVPDLKSLVGQMEHGLAPGAWYEVYFLDGQRDGLEQIDVILRNYHRQLDAVHLIAHGETGSMQVGATRLDLDTLDGLASGLSPWQQAFAPQGDLLLYGCDVAAGPSGEEFVSRLREVTGVDVAASTDVTGSAELGGDWQLEYQAGTIDARTLSASSWNGALAAPVIPAWYSGSWTYRKQITIDHNRVSGGADLTDFPVFINLGADANLAANALASGNDILFTSADGTTKLSHEIESYTSASGALVAWVKVPTLSVTTDTVLYIYYGNGAAANQQNATGVWSNGYAGVWHLNGGAADSTTNANNGTVNGATGTGGLMGQALDFNGSTSYVSVANSASLQLTSTLTLQGWVRARTFGSADDVDVIIRKGDANPNNYELALQNQAGYFFLDGDDNGAAGPRSAVLSPNTWYYVVGTWDGTTARLYVNGVLEASAADTTPTTDTREVYIGGRIGSTDVTDGIVDEVRASSVPRSADWIATEYSNQNAPGTFASVGGQQTAWASLAGTDEDTISSGTTVSTILSSVGGLDYDIGALAGIAITSRVGNGTWQYSTDGAIWTGFGGVSGTTALLLESATQVRYVPDALNGETPTFTFRAWDQTTGAASTNGAPSYADPGAGGGASAYSSQSAIASMTVASVNDAPVANAGGGLTAINEDDVANSGNLVSGLAGGITDVDVGALNGIAVHAVDNTNGTWQYTLDGTTWFAIGSVSTTSARLLPADATTRIRFVPSANWNGTTGLTSFLAWDRTSGTSGGLADVSTSAGTTAFSSGSLGSSLDVLAVNDLPVLAGIEGAALAYTENDPATPITGTLTVGDVDDVNIESAQVRISVGYASGEDLLAFVNTATIVGTWDPASGTLTLTGADTPANYQAALRSVTYANSSENPAIAARTIQFSVNDGDGNSNIVTRSVTVARVNDAPVITSDGGGASASIGIPENTSAVTTVTGTDVDSGGLVFSIAGGVDAARFTIDSATGVLTFILAPDFETPTDFGANNVYDVIVQVSDGSANDTQAIAVTVTPVNDNAPTITSAATVNVAENTTSVTVVTATDADLPGPTLTYSISGGVDAGRFTIDPSTGALAFAAAPDFETPTDVGTDNVYDVTVQVTDGTFSDAQSIAVTVTAGNDNAPTITSNGGGASATVNVAENVTSVTTVTATDADLPGPTLTYSISGADAGRFTIDPSTGALAFAAAPDFETPTDVGTDNVYDVTVQVTDGTFSDAQSIIVTVTPVNDNAPTITSAATANVAENTTAVTTVTGADADLPAQTLSYAIVGGADAASFTIDPSTGALVFVAAPDFEAPADTGGDNVYDVIVQVSDGTFSATQAIAVAVTPVADNVPTIVSDAGGPTAAVNVAENATAVTTVAATDADLPAEPFTFTIVGGADAARFDIDPVTGALTFLTAPDYESPADVDSDNVYDVIVQVSDGAFSDTQSLSVSVTGVNDNVPSITSDGGGASASVSIGENSTAVTTVTGADADLPAQTLTYAIVGGADAARFTIDAATGALSFTSAPDFEAPADAGADNVYDVTVAASDGTFAITQDIAVTVANGNETPVALDDGFVTNEDTPLVVDLPGLLANDTDPDTDPLAAILVNGPANGVITLSADGSLVYVPNANFHGTDSFTYRVSDGALVSNLASALVTILSVNDAPEVLSEAGFAYTDYQDQIIRQTSSELLVNGTDADGDPLTIILVAGTQHGSLALHADGTFVYVPDVQYVGVDDFWYRISDGQALSAPVHVTIRVQARPQSSALSPPPPSPGPVSVPTSGGTSTPVVATANSSSSTENGRLLVLGGGVGGSSEEEAPSEAVVLNPTRGDAHEAKETPTAEVQVAVRSSEIARSAFSTWSNPAVVAPPPAAAFIQAWTRQSAQLFRELDVLGESLEQTVSRRHSSTLVVGGVTVTFTGGYVMWNLRTIYLLITAMAARPMWRNLDPLAVLDTWEKREEKVEKMFE